MSSHSDTCLSNHFYLVTIFWPLLIRAHNFKNFRTHIIEHNFKNFRTHIIEYISGLCGATGLLRQRPPHVRDFEITHTDTLARTPLDEGSAGRRDLYLTTKHPQETDIHTSAGFEPTIPASEWPQTHTLDRMATRLGSCFILA
jgi:hypothetical protein